MKNDQWRLIRDRIIEQLKGYAIKAAIKKILGSAAVGGLKAWIIKFIVSELFEEVAEPLLKFAVRKGYLLYDKIDGNLKVKKVYKAKESGDEKTYIATIGKL